MMQVNKYLPACKLTQVVETPHSYIYYYEKGSDLAFGPGPWNILIQAWCSWKTSETILQIGEPLLRPFLVYSFFFHIGNSSASV
jgi:hypothetical protein